MIHDLIIRASESYAIDFNQLTLAIIFLLIIIIIISQASRLKHKKNRNYLQLTQKELEQRITERTEKLRTLNSQLYSEIEKHKDTEMLLSNTRNYLSSIINSMPSILIGVTANGFITHWNTAAQDATQISEENALGKYLLDVYPTIPVTLTAIKETIDTRMPRLTENIQEGHGSHTHNTDLTIYPLVKGEMTGAVIRLDDVTMRVRVENMMIHNEKMMSLGELAAGMAHEINNPLSAMINSVQNIQRRTSDSLPANRETAAKHGMKIEQIRNYLSDREIFKFLDSIREAGDRAARIVTNMLEFSRNNNKNHELIDIIKLTEHALELAGNSFELKTPDGCYKINVITEFETNIPAFKCSAPELQQVILNLLHNACQAFTDTKWPDYKHNSYANAATPKVPTITLRLYQWDNNICIEVEDNGNGMPESVRRHVFEPFYTTKEVGKGTGLGLSVTYFIVTEHHEGTIDVESTPGEGTNFIVTLPMNSTKQ
jgi:PAS domain S-box-containing protein